MTVYIFATFLSINMKGITLNGVTLAELKIKELVKTNYGITVNTLRRLHGYEDINIYFTTDETIPGMTRREFVLKVVTEAVTLKVTNAELQHKLMLYLEVNGIKTNTPIKTIDNDTLFTSAVQHENSSGIKILGYVLTYLPGQTMHAVDNPECVLEDIGQLAGKVDTLLKAYDDGIVYTFNTLWELTRVPDIEDKMIDHCEHEVQLLGQDIISAYKQYVFPNLNSFQKGLIHGDLNNCNILLKKINNFSIGSSSYTVSGLIDFGDVCYSYYIYEIAVLIADIMSSKLSRDVSPLDAARRILRGYVETFPLQDIELNCLRIIICVRLLQYFVLSAVALSKNPDNEYAGCGRDGYIKICKYLWNMDEERFRQSVILN